MIKEVAKNGDSTAFLEHSLGNIITKVLSKLGNDYI